MKELFFHEDFYCQVELVPVSAVQHCTEEMHQVDDFSAAHWDGTAWKSMYLRDDHSTYLRSLGIRIQDIALKLDSILERVDAVFTGYSTYREECSNTRGWVFPCGCGLLAEYDADGVVQNLWVDDAPDVASLGRFKEVIEVLNGYSQFVIADWNRTVLVSCEDDDELHQYLVSPSNEAESSSR